MLPDQPDGIPLVWRDIHRADTIVVIMPILFSPVQIIALLRRLPYCSCGVHETSSLGGAGR